METLTFKLADIHELDAVFNIYIAAIKEMDDAGISQWDEIYPSRVILEEDIKNKHLYLGKINENIICSYALNQLCDEEYSSGAWTHTDSPFYVIHRLCVNTAYQNRGVAKLTMEYIEAFIKNLGAKTIRLDAFSKNPYALRLYSKVGYVTVGSVRFRKGDFLLMEKVI